jgi:hypothetical protein
MVALAVLDTTLAGFRAAAGRDGRIDKRYARAMRLGFGAGVGVAALAGLATAVVALRPGGAEVYADLVRIGLRMLPVFGVFGLMVIAALAVYAASRHEVRTFATVAILGPFTLARPWVIVLATVYGVVGAHSVSAVALTVLASAGVLAAERWLSGVLSKATAWTHPERAPEPADEPPDAPDRVHALPIEESIDLHFFAPRDIPSVVDEYLREAARKGFTEVRLIHGKGKGVQRARVQKVLARHPAVTSFRSDGTGSTLAELRPKKTRARRT